MLQCPSRLNRQPHQRRRDVLVHALRPTPDRTQLQRQSTLLPPLLDLDADTPHIPLDLDRAHVDRPALAREVDDPRRPARVLVLVDRESRPSSPNDRRVGHREDVVLPVKVVRGDGTGDGGWVGAREELEHLRSKLARLGIPQRARRW